MAPPTCPPSGPSPTPWPSTIQRAEDRRHQEHGPGRHQSRRRRAPGGAQSADARRGQQSRVPQGRGGHRGLHEARPRGRRRAPAGGGRGAARAVRPVPAHGAAVPGHVAGERRDDQVRRQRHAGDEDQLHQRDGQPVRTHGRRHQRRAPRHRPRWPHRLLSSSFPAPATGAVASPKTCALCLSMSKQPGCARARDGCGGSRQRGAEAGAGPQGARALRRPALQEQDAGRLGPGVQAAHRRHPRGPGPGPHRRPAGRRRHGCASTIRRRWPTSRPSTATS